MLSSILLHLEQAQHGQAVIRLGVPLAISTQARVRGLTLLDTRGVESALTCEAAVYALAEQRRAACAKRQQQAMRVAVSQACLQAGLNFDVRQGAGDPLQVLPQEAKFHDLVITSLGCAPSGEAEPRALSPRDLVALLDRGVEPFILVHPEQTAFERVLLLYDGSEAAGRAIRSYLGLGILRPATHRLLGIGKSERQSRAALREMAEFCLPRIPCLETGYLTGRPRSVLLRYAQKWQADLVVWGFSRGNRLWRGLLGEPALELCRKLPCGVYVTT